MDKKQIKWATNLDCFVDITDDGTGVIIRDVAYNIHTGITTISYTEHTDFSELRAHVGY